MESKLTPGKNLFKEGLAQENDEWAYVSIFFLQKDKKKLKCRLFERGENIRTKMLFVLKIVLISINHVKNLNNWLID